MLYFSAERLKFGFTSTEKLILFSSSEPLDNFNKGFDLLLESLKLINTNTSYKLIVIGHSKPNKYDNNDFSHRVKILYFKMQYMALIPSFQFIFFPSS